MRRQRAGIGQRWRKGCRSYGRRFVTTSASPPIPFRLFAARAIRPASRSVVVLHFVRRRFFADAEQEISDLFWPDFSMPSESFPRKLFFSAEFSPSEGDEHFSTQRTRKRSKQPNRIPSQ